MIAELEDIAKALHRWILVGYNRLTQFEKMMRVEKGIMKQERGS
jgi:hypothetical protein